MSKQFEFKRSENCPFAIYTTNEIDGAYAELISVADRWLARITVERSRTLAENDYPLSERRKAMDFCLKQLADYLDNNLSWQEWEPSTPNTLYNEWNYYSKTKKLYYKIYHKCDLANEYNCLTLKHTGDEFVPVGEIKILDDLDKAKKYFLALEKNQ